MQILYIDNIRGFSDTAVPIRPVSFFVGENSTGKSTVLALFHILNTYNFWTEPGFDSETHNLGGFSDMISSNSRNQSNFTLGLMKSTRKGTSQPGIGAVFVTFESDEGLPIATRYSYLSDSSLVTIGSTKDSYYYKIAKAPQTTAETIFTPVNVKALAKEHASEEGLQKLKVPQGINPSGVPLFIVAQFIPEKKRNERAMPMGLMDFIHPSSPLVWIAPIRTKPKRTYDGARVRFSEDGNHTPYVLRSNLRSKASTKFKKSLFEVGQSGHIYDGISIKRFGESDRDPFELHAVFGKHSYPIAHVGYGVSQVLPIITEALTAPQGASFIIQQPEVHLHPRAQASLGELIHTLATSENKSFAIETHSDFLIDRFRVEIRKNKTQPKSSVLFFHRTPDGNEVTEILIEENGAYSAEQPDDFREFFIHEQCLVLGI